MRRRSSIYRWCWVMVIALTPKFVSAQPVDLDTLVTQGIQLRNQGRDTEALESFRQAVALDPKSPRALGHLALALHAMQYWLESERVMLDVIRATDDPWVQRHEGVLKQSLEEVQSHLAWLEVDTPNAGKLWVGDVLVGDAPTKEPIRVVAGTNVVRFEVPTRAPIKRTITIPARRQFYISLPEAAVFVPPQVHQLPTNLSHKTAAPKAPDSERTTNGWVMTLLGFGAAGVAASVALGIESYVLRNRSHSCQDGVCTANNLKADARGRQAATLSTISFAVGASAIGVSSVLLW